MPNCLICRLRGINRKVNLSLLGDFMRLVVEKNYATKEEYLDKLEKIRNGKFILLKNIIERYY